MHKREEMRGYKEIYAVNIRKHKCCAKFVKTNCKKNIYR